MDKNQREALAQRLIKLSLADETEVSISCEKLALSRFAHEDIHQNIASDVITVRLRIINDKRCGVATTNAIDDESLQNLVDRVNLIARFSPRDEHWPGLPQGGTPEPAPETAYVEATAQATADDRADIADAVFRVSQSHQLWGAGYISTSQTRVTIANSHGRLASFDGTESLITLKQNSNNSTGYGESSSPNIAMIDGSAVSELAAQKALDTKDPQSVDPGSWTVILEPAAFAELLSYLTDHFSAQTVDEGASFIQWESLGTRIVSPAFSLWDDWQNALAPGMPFDFEGTPRQRLPLIEQGVAKNIVTDSHWAARLNRPNTGHALPPPNQRGPQALFTIVDPGTTSLESLIASVEHGLYISRFWYIRPVDRRQTIVTGMTRDGTYLIKDGKLSNGVHNLRFNQSIISALQNITLSNTVRRSSGLDYTMVVPAAKIEGFTFSSTTSF